MYGMAAAVPYGTDTCSVWELCSESLGVGTCLLRARPARYRARPLTLLSACTRRQALVKGTRAVGPLLLHGCFLMARTTARIHPRRAAPLTAASGFPPLWASSAFSVSYSFDRAPLYFVLMIFSCLRFGLPAL